MSVNDARSAREWKGGTVVGDESITTQVQQLRKVIAYATRWMWINACIALLGSAISAGTYAEAATRDGGGAYVVMWGAVVFGFVFAVRHYLRRRRAKHLLAAMLTWVMEQRALAAAQAAQRAADQESSAPAPGWYPSGTSPNVQRWWTGTAWGPTGPA